MERVAHARRRLLRLKGRGRKSLRPGHVILDGEGKPAGEVTSFAYVDEARTFILLACVEETFAAEPGQTATGARLKTEKIDGPVPERAQVKLECLPRFADEDEKEAWAAHYGRRDID
jgi:glycine cleavage system aminomethyltransferase T